MRTLIVDDDARAEALAEALAAERIAVERPPHAPLSDAGDDEVEQIAGALIALEELVAGDAPDAVLLAGSSNLALAAALVATKLQIPLVALDESPRTDVPGQELNRRLIERLADGLVEADASAVAAWLRGSGAD
jgi:UDP-N-acetylglucosamine 2-epimerase